MNVGSIKENPVVVLSIDKMKKRYIQRVNSYTEELFNLK